MDRESLISVSLHPVGISFGALAVNDYRVQPRSDAA